MTGAGRPALGRSPPRVSDRPSASSRLSALDPDGSPATLDTDLLGERKDPARTYPAGPLASLRAGAQRTRVW